MSESKKPLTKMEWMKKELAADDYHPTEAAINRVLAGTPSHYLEEALIDYIEELNREWVLKNPV